MSVLQRTLRVVKNNKLSFCINVLSLSTGLVTFIFIILWVQKETGYNTFLKNENVCQVYTNYNVNGKLTSVRATSYPLIYSLERNIPEIEEIAFTMGMEALSIGADNQKHQASGRFANKNFFKVIPRPFLYGSAQDALIDPLSIVLSSAFAEKLYGKNWRGKVGDKYILIDGYKELRVTGVFESFPANSTIQSAFFLPLSPDSNEHIGNYNYEAYVKLNTQANVTKAIGKINQQIAPLTPATLGLQSFKDIYLYSNFSNGGPAAEKLLMYAYLPLRPFLC